MSRPTSAGIPFVGMGCSRLGSLLAKGDADAAAAAVRAALDAGVTFFDTSNIYGQGSSELILGRTLPRDGVKVATKAGFVTPLPLWVLRTVKPALRMLVQRRKGVRSNLADRRSGSYPQRFDAAYLARCLRGSLRRLRRERTDLFLLHNATPEVAARDDLWRWVETELKRGRIGAFGVSCMGEPGDAVWLRHDAVTALQVPASSLLAGGTLDAPGRFVVAREIVGPGVRTTSQIVDAIRTVAATGRADVALVGMSSAGHVRSLAAGLAEPARHDTAA